MLQINLKAAAIATLVCVSPAKAREVDLTLFSSLGVVSSDEKGRVGVALGTYFQDLNQPSAPPAVHKAVKAIAARSISFSCFSNGYIPTWWLSPEVENRRAAYFAAMSATACENGLPESLLDAVIAQESGYKAWALSRAGAMGMMQVMPGTARNLELRNPWDALANMRAGARYLRQQLDRFGRVDLALAAYNAGPERRSLALGNVPAIAETVNYVRAITTNWVRLTQIEVPNPNVAARATAANMAVRASGYREVSLISYQGTNAGNPI